jgi:hypothetical protein
MDGSFKFHPSSMDVLKHTAQIFAILIHLPPSWVVLAFEFAAKNGDRY